MNITFGLNDYGKLKYMLAMADLLKQKKREEMRKGREKQIEVIQEKARVLLVQMEEYAEKNKPKAVVAYVQFESMEGKEKFIKFIKVNRCYRACCP